MNVSLDSEAVVASTSGSGGGKKQTTKRRKLSSDDDDEDTATDVSGDNASSVDSEVTRESAVEPPAVPKRLRTQRSAKQKVLSKMSARGRGRGWSSV